MMSEGVILVTLDGNTQRTSNAIAVGGGTASTDSDICQDIYAKDLVIINNSETADVQVRFGNRTGTPTAITASNSYTLTPGSSRHLETDHQRGDLGEGFPLSALHLKGTAAETVTVIYDKHLSFLGL